MTLYVDGRKLLVFQQLEKTFAGLNQNENLLFVQAEFHFLRHNFRLKDSQLISFLDTAHAVEQFSRQF
jgi:hypothetical protein